MLKYVENCGPRHPPKRVPWVRCQIFFNFIHINFFTQPKKNYNRARVIPRRYYICFLILHCLLAQKKWKLKNCCKAADSPLFIFVFSGHKWHLGWPKMVHWWLLMVKTGLGWKFHVSSITPIWNQFSYLIITFSISLRWYCFIFDLYKWFNKSLCLYLYVTEMLKVATKGTSNLLGSVLQQLLPSTDCSFTKHCFVLETPTCI